MDLPPNALGYFLMAPVSVRGVPVEVGVPITDPQLLQDLDEAGAPLVAVSVYTLPISSAYRLLKRWGGSFSDFILPLLASTIGAFGAAIGSLSNAVSDLQNSIADLQQQIDDLAPAAALVNRFGSTHEANNENSALVVGHNNIVGLDAMAVTLALPNVSGSVLPGARVVGTTAVAPGGGGTIQMNAGTQQIGAGYPGDAGFEVVAITTWTGFELVYSPTPPGSPEPYYWHILSQNPSL